MNIFKSIVVAYLICFLSIYVYLILKITSPELFIKDRCKLILGFAHFVLPEHSNQSGDFICI